MNCKKNDKFDLLECPFCKSKNLRDLKEDGCYFVLCNNCFAEGPKIRKMITLDCEHEAARLAWNIRK